MEEVKVEELKKSIRGNRAKIATIDDFCGSRMEDLIRLVYLFDDYPPIDEEALRKAIEPLMNNK